jgi:hypothetical protein
MRDDPRFAGAQYRYAAAFTRLTTLTKMEMSWSASDGFRFASTTSLLTLTPIPHPSSLILSLSPSFPEV